MYLRGEKIADIADQLKLSPRTIKSDLKRARQSWRERAADTYQHHLDEQLAKLDEIESAAWLGWERSLQDEVESGTENSETPKGPVAKKKHLRKSRSGNASFLKIVNDTVRQRSELLGLLDIESRNSNLHDDEAEVVSVVIETREEAKELRTLSLSDYRQKLAGAAG